MALPPTKPPPAPTTVKPAAAQPGLQAIKPQSYKQGTPPTPQSSLQGISPAAPPAAKPVTYNYGVPPTQPGLRATSPMPATKPAYNYGTPPAATQPRPAYNVATRSMQPAMSAPQPGRATYNVATRSMQPAVVGQQAQNVDVTPRQIAQMSPTQRAQFAQRVQAGAGQPRQGIPPTQQQQPIPAPAPRALPPTRR